MPRLTPTTEIRIEPSTRCNYHCTMCSRDTFRRRREVMTNARFERIVSQARQTLPHLALCTVSGFGELATDPHWKDKLALARTFFPRVHVVTNLSLVADRDLADLARLATEVRVSLSAVDDETLQAIHRPPALVSYAQLAARIQRLAEHRSAEFSLRLTCSALPENEALLEQWIETWQPLVDGLEIWRPHNWVTGQRFRKTDGKRVASCGRPATGPLQVQVDGTMNVCCFDYNGEMLIGDLNRQTFAEILTGEPLARIRHLHATGGADELPLCARCDQREPNAQRARYLIYSTEPAEVRVRQTSSGRETLAEIALSPHDEPGGAI